MQTSGVQFISDDKVYEEFETSKWTAQLAARRNLESFWTNFTESLKDSSSFPRNFQQILKLGFTITR